MADEPRGNIIPDDPEDPLGEEFPLDGIQRFLDQKWSNAVCERCAANDWGIAQSRRGRSVGVVLTDRFGAFADLVPGKPLDLRPLIVITCRNCGNVRLTDAGIVRRWLDLEAAAG